LKDYQKLTLMSTDRIKWEVEQNQEEVNWFEVKDLIFKTFQLFKTCL